jgi:tRNA-specific 2-thiouridylase
VPTGRYTQVIERLRPGAAEAGDIVHVDGRVLGRHGGIINYTIGQRKGLGVSAREPLYVLKLDAARRQVVVGPREALRTRYVALRHLNWLGDEPIEEFVTTGQEVLVRIRSSGPLQPAKLSFADNEVMVELLHGEDGVSPGQACVFYAAQDGGERLLGGGYIKSAAGEAWLTEDAFKPSLASGRQEAFAAGSQ